MKTKPEDNISNYPNSIDTRVALLEMSISHIKDALNRMDARFDKIDIKLDKIDSKIDSRFFWLLSLYIGGFAGLLGVLARVARWI